MNKIITKELLIDLREGNHEAFDTLFFAYYSKIKFFIKGLVRSENDAEELTQDVFVKLWTNREALDPEKSVTSLIYTMARNASLNLLKRRFVHDKYVQNYKPEDEFESSEELMFAKETMLLIDMAVAGMPEQRRKIYNLSRRQGMGNEEISKTLGISKKTVENQLSLALKEIKKVVSLLILFFA